MRFWVLAIAVSVLAVTGVSAAEGSSPAATSWHSVAQLSYGYTAATSCPSAEVCWALSGGRLEYTADGGNTWTDRSALVPLSIVSIQTIDCPAVDTCYLAGRDGSSPALARVTPTGAVVVDVASDVGASALSCLSASQCVALGQNGEVYVTSDSGTTWPAVSSLPGYLALSCVAGTSTCWAVGYDAANQTTVTAHTTTAGRRWAQTTLPATIGYLSVLNCPTRTDCVAGSYVVASTHDGTTWVPGTLPADIRQIESISCVDASICEAVAFGTAELNFEPTPIRSTDGGLTWQDQSFGRAVRLGRASVSCATATRCVVGSAVDVSLATNDGGGRWTSAPVANYFASPLGLQCPTATQCIALQGGESPVTAATSADGGATWTSHALPTSGKNGGLLQCPTPSVCFAEVGGSSPDLTTVVTSVDGGATWTVVNGAPTLSDLQCLSATTCVGIGTSLWVTTDGGASWQAHRLPNIRGVHGLECTSLAQCIVVGQIVKRGSPRSPTPIAVTTDLGQHYTNVSLPFVLETRVSCVATTCYAGGYDPWSLLKSTDGGLTWAASGLDNVGMYAIDCASPTACVAITSAPTGYELQGTVDGGQTWRVRYALPSGDIAEPLTCRPGLCRALTYLGTVLAGSP